MRYCFAFSLFLFNDPSTTEIYTLSLHDALPIYLLHELESVQHAAEARLRIGHDRLQPVRSEEHTSELQSHSDLVCRLLLEKKKKLPIPFHMVNGSTPSRSSSSLASLRHT